MAEIVKMAKVVAINNGYYNYKGEYDIIFPSRLMIAPYEEVLTTSDKLKLDDITYIVGDGTPMLEMEKDKGNFTRVLVLNMLAHIMLKEKSKKDNFKLVLSAPPIMHFKNSTDGDLREYLKGSYKFKWNGKELDVTIEDVAVFPETFVAYSSVNTDGQYDDSTVYIIDIGGYATNIVRIRNGNFTDKSYITILNGMYHVDSSISQYLNQKFTKYNLNSTYADIEEYRRNGLYFDQEGRKTNFYIKESSAIENIAKSHFEDLLTECATKKWNLGSGQVIIIGGGGEGMFDIIRTHFFKTARLSETALWDNFLGLCEMKEIFSSED